MSLPRDFSKKYGPWALVTEACNEAGYEYSRLLASYGFKLVLISSESQALHALAKEVRSTQGALSLPLHLDLAGNLDSALATLREKTAELDLGLMIHTAGVHVQGMFIDADKEAFREMLELNVSAVIALSNMFAKIFVNSKRARSGMVYLCQGADVGMPSCAAISAANAFVKEFVHGIGEELKREGVDVLCVNVPCTNESLKETMRISPDGLGSIDTHTTGSNGYDDLEPKHMSRRLMNFIHAGKLIRSLKQEINANVPQVQSGVGHETSEASATVSAPPNDPSQSSSRLGMGQKEPKFMVEKTLLHLGKTSMYIPDTQHRLARFVISSMPPSLRYSLLSRNKALHREDPSNQGPITASAR